MQEKGQCAVLAIADGTWGAARADTLSDAQEAALGACRDSGGASCTLRRWTCN